MFLRNYWYAAAWSNDIGRELFARTILGEPIVFYRSENGDPYALADRCPHRQAPLSLGKLVGDNVQCGYHGLCYDGTGTCVRIPGQYTIPPTARVKTYPVTDKWGWVWIWMGDAELADEALITDYHWNDDPDWTAIRDLVPIRGHYQLLVDNLLELSHLAYVHQSTIGNEAVAEASITCERTEQSVRVVRQMRDIPPPPLWALTRNITTNVDRWHIIDSTPPANVVIETGGAPAGTNGFEGDRSNGLVHMILIPITPETESSSHLFWSIARNHHLGDEEFSKKYLEEVSQTFQEDVDMIEAQQRNMNLDFGDNGFDLNADNGPIQARRIVDRLLQSETVA
jgi:vanillate O-demethylase monooxygenase subunit